MAQPTRRAARTIITAGSLLVTGLAAGCDWSLAFESGSLDIVEDLICPECDDPPKNPDVGGGGSPGTSGPSDGDSGGDAGGAPDDEPEVNAGNERAGAIVAGRRWNVEAMAAEVTTDHAGYSVIAVSARVSVAGVEGESTVYVPTSAWPVDAEAAPALFEIGGASVGPRQSPSMTIGGKEYLLEFVSTTARIDETPAGPRLRGAVDAHAVSLAHAGKANAPKQLVRLTFDADVDD